MSSLNKGKKTGKETKFIVAKKVEVKSTTTEKIEDEQTKRIIAVRKVMRERDKCRLETEDFAKSDLLREKLKVMGVDVIDQVIMM